MGIFVNRERQIRSGWKIAMVIILSFVFQFAVSFIWGIVYTISMMASGKFSPQDMTPEKMNLMVNASPVASLIISLLSILAMVLAVFIVLKLCDKKKFRHIGVAGNKRSYKELWYGLLLGAASMTLIFFILLLAGNIKLTNGFTQPQFSVYTLTGLILYIGVGFEEELFSRGYCMMVLEQTKTKWVPVIVSSIIFSLLHTLNPNVKLLGLANIFLVGILFAYMVMRTGSIMMAIGYHITWNYFQGNVFGFPVSGTAPHGIYGIEVLKDNILTGGAFGPEAGILTTIVIISGIFIVSRYGGRMVGAKLFSASDEIVNI